MGYKNISIYWTESFIKLHITCNLNFLWFSFYKNSSQLLLIRLNEVIIDNTSSWLTMVSR